MIVGSENKTPVFGVVERRDKLKAAAVLDTKGKTIIPIIEDNVEKGSQIYTDEYPVNNKLPKRCNNHERVLHVLHNFCDE